MGKSKDNNIDSPPTDPINTKSKNSTKNNDDKVNTVYVCGLYDNGEEVRIITVFKNQDDAYKWTKDVSVHLQKIATEQDPMSYIKKNTEKMEALLIPTNYEWTKTFIIKSQLISDLTYPMQSTTEHIQ